jgi:hypothetical protein
MRAFQCENPASVSIGFSFSLKRLSVVDPRCISVRAMRVTTASSRDVQSRAGCTLNSTSSPSGVEIEKLSFRSGFDIIPVEFLQRRVVGHTVPSSVQNPATYTFGSPSNANRWEKEEKLQLKQM